MKILYRKGAYKYQLVSEIKLYIPELSDLKSYNGRFITLVGGWLTMRDGYAWDGPSGPTIDTANFMRGSLVHDALYQLMREKHLDTRIHREIADKILRSMFIKDSDHIIEASNSWGWIKATKKRAARVRAGYIYYSVRMFGESSATQKPRKVYEAP